MTRDTSHAGKKGNVLSNSLKYKYKLNKQHQKNNLHITNHATRFSSNCFNQLKRVCSHVLMSSIMPTSIFQRSFLQVNQDFKASTDATLSTQSILTITFSTFSANGKTVLSRTLQEKKKCWVAFFLMHFLFLSPILVTISCMKQGPQIVSHNPIITATRWKVQCDRHRGTLSAPENWHHY